MLKIVEKNTRGQDFIIGDLHGQFDLFQRMLDFVDFDPRADRVFSVGDLVDRGEKNLECLRLLRESWFHAVMGNHEEMMVDNLFATGSGTGGWWEYNGGGWFQRLTKDEKNEVVTILQSQTLPLCIEVRDQFRVLHAELANTEIKEAEFHNVFAKEALAHCSEGGPHIIWGRTLAWTKENVKWGALPIFCGHTIHESPTKYGNLINLDTCAFGVGRKPWCGLTFTQFGTNKFWKVTDDINEVELHNVL